MPGGLSSIPAAAAAIASKPQIARRISVIFLLCGVEKALVMIVMQLIQMPAQILVAANIVLPEPALAGSAFSQRMVC
jgi:hypothetical protein